MGSPPCEKLYNIYDKSVCFSVSGKQMAALISPTHANNVRVKGSIPVMNGRESNLAVA
jgi:hypothetical protein